MTLAHSFEHKSDLSQPVIPYNDDIANGTVRLVEYNWFSLAAQIKEAEYLIG